MNATCHTLSFGSCGGMVVVSSMVWETVSGRGIVARRRHGFVRLKSAHCSAVTCHWKVRETVTSKLRH